MTILGHHHIMVKHPIYLFYVIQETCNNTIFARRMSSSWIFYIFTCIITLHIWGCPFTRHISQEGTVGGSKPLCSCCFAVLPSLAHVKSQVRWVYLRFAKRWRCDQEKKLSAAFLLFFHKTDKTILRVGNSKKGFYRCQTIIYSFCFAPRS